MSSRTAKFLRKLKENEPERYQAFRERSRLQNKKYRDKKKERFETGVITKAMEEEKERERASRRERDRRYREKKAAEYGHQIRPRNEKPRSPGAKRRCEMTPDEQKRYDAQIRREYNWCLPAPKKAALKEKNRERMRIVRQKAKFSQDNEASKGLQNYVKGEGANGKSQLVEDQHSGEQREYNHIVSVFGKAALRKKKQKSKKAECSPKVEANERLQNYGEEANGKSQSVEEEQASSGDQRSVSVGQAIGENRLLSRTCMYGRRLKENDPEKYKAFLERCRLQNKKYRDTKKDKFKSGVITKAMEEERERERASRRERDCRYRKRKAAKCELQMQPRMRDQRPPGSKRRCEMSPGERKRYDAKVRKEYNHGLPQQKLLALRMKNRERMRATRQKAKFSQQHEGCEATEGSLKSDKENGADGSSQSAQADHPYSIQEGKTSVRKKFTMRVIFKKVSPKQSDTDGAVQQLPVSGASQVVAATRRSERQQNKVKMSSPNKEVWQNPKDVMKTHRIKRQSSTTKRDQAKTSSVTKSGVKSSSAVKSSALEEGRNQKFQNDSQSLKRKNPFICETSTQNTIKRRSILDSQLSVRTSADSDSHSERKEDLNNTNLPTTNESPSLSSKLIDILTEAENMSGIGTKSFGHRKSSALLNKTDEQQVSCSSQNHNSTSSSSFTERIEDNSSISEKNLEAKKHHPTDWSLKTKMRVVVESREETFRRIPGIDAKNVFNFVHHTLQNGSDWKELDIFQKLRRCCLHYSYPQYPWMRKFPRMSGDFRSRSMSFLSNNEDVLSDIQSDWSSVFTALYQQLRGGICPYFYVCTHQFTVLFRCQRFSPKEASFSALLSPSTRGFREMLSKEDITFRLPNIDMHKIPSDEIKPKVEFESPSSAQVRSPSTVDNQGDNTDKTGPVEDAASENEDEEDDINDHHGASEWLEQMGLERKDFPSLEPLKVKLQRDGYREIDNRPQSMVYVEGGDVHAFFNFLLNYPSCIASSGPQHGLPPTLLSPVPFVGGALVQNTVKHSQLRDVPVKLPGTEQNMYSHVFEISGPILPHHTLNIAAILEDYHAQQQGSSVVTYNTHLPSAALNTQAVNQPETDRLAVNLHKLFVDFDLANKGLLSSCKDSLGSKPKLSSGAFLREMKISQQGYLWS